MQVTGTVRTPIGEMRIDDGVLWHRLDTQNTITEEDATAVIDAVFQLTNGVPHPAVVDIGDVGFASLAARRKFAGSTHESMELATALVVRHPASRLMAEAYLKIARPQRPVRVFADAGAAQAWALDYVTSTG